MTENNEQFSDLSPNTQQHSEGLDLTTIRMKYYDLKKNWHRVKLHLEDKELNDILVRDFNKFTFGRWGRQFTHGGFTLRVRILSLGLGASRNAPGVLAIRQTRRLSLVG